MKFFYKMFLGMTVILAVALGMIEYVTLSYSLEHAVKREQDSALSQHQMIKYSIETVILNMKSEDVDKELTDMMSQSAKSIVGDEGGMYLADDDGKGYMPIHVIMSKGYKGKGWYAYIQYSVKREY